MVKNFPKVMKNNKSWIQKNYISQADESKSKPHLVKTFFKTTEDKDSNRILKAFRGRGLFAFYRALFCWLLK